MYFYQPDCRGAVLPFEGEFSRISDGISTFVFFLWCTLEKDLEIYFYFQVLFSRDSASFSFSVNLFRRENDDILAQGVPGCCWR